MQWEVLMESTSLICMSYRTSTKMRHLLILKSEQVAPQ